MVMVVRMGSAGGVRVGGRWVLEWALGGWVGGFMGFYYWFVRMGLVGVLDGGWLRGEWHRESREDVC